MLGAAVVLLAIVGLHKRFGGKPAEVAVHGSAVIEMDSKHKDPRQDKCYDCIVSCKRDKIGDKEFCRKEMCDRPCRIAVDKWNREGGAGTGGGGSGFSPE